LKKSGVEDTKGKNNGQVEDRVKRAYGVASRIAPEDKGEITIALLNSGFE